MPGSSRSHPWRRRRSPSPSSSSMPAAAAASSPRADRRWILSTTRHARRRTAAARQGRRRDARTRHRRPHAPASPAWRRAGGTRGTRLSVPDAIAHAIRQTPADSLRVGPSRSCAIAICAFGILTVYSASYTPGTDSPAPMAMRQLTACFAAGPSSCSRCSASTTAGSSGTRTSSTWSCCSWCSRSR